MERKPRVALILTGGTIDSVGTDRLDLAWYLEANQRLADGELVGRVPELATVAEVEEIPFRRLPSQAITDGDLLDLVRTIHGIFEEDRADGIVITHGTNTLEETAYFLHLTLKTDRPVVLVGAMRPSSAISADGYLNLLNGVRVAASKDAAEKGVLVVLNEDIAAARDVWKTDNRRVHTFRSPELGLIGFADPDTVIFYRSPLRPHTWQSEFDLGGIDSLPRVDLAVDYTGFDGSTIDYLAGRGPDGIVLATFAGGRMSAGARRAVAEAVEARIPLVIASRVPGGRIVANPLGDGAAIIARDLPAHKARILLMLALTRTRALGEIQQIFDTY